MIHLTLLGSQERLAYLQDEAKRLLRRRITPTIQKIADRFPLSSRYAIPRDFGAILAIDFRPPDEYVPTLYTGRVTLFRARKQAAGSIHDPQFGWGQLAAGGVEVHLIPGYRFIVHEPRVRRLAEHLRACLQRAQATAATT